MLTSSEVLKYVKAVPFRPFRLDMASGKTFDIRHPEMIKVGKTVLAVFWFSANDPDVWDEWTSVALMLIESISHLDGAVGT